MQSVVFKSPPVWGEGKKPRHESRRNVLFASHCRDPFSRNAREILRVATHRRRSFPTQHSYSRRAPAHSLTTPDGSHYGNESSRRMRKRHRSARARVEAVPLPSGRLSIPTTRTTRDRSVDRLLCGRAVFKSRILKSASDCSGLELRWDWNLIGIKKN